MIELVKDVCMHVKPFFSVFYNSLNLFKCNYTLDFLSTFLLLFEKNSNRFTVFHAECDSNEQMETTFINWLLNSYSGK